MRKFTQIDLIPGTDSFFPQTSSQFFVVFHINYIYFLKKFVYPFAFRNYSIGGDDQITLREPIINLRIYFFLIYIKNMHQSNYPFTRLAVIHVKNKNIRSLIFCFTV